MEEGIGGRRMGQRGEACGGGEKGGRKGGGFNQVLVVEGRSSEWRSSEK